MNLLVIDDHVIVCEGGRRLLAQMSESSEREELPLWHGQASFTILSAVGGYLSWHVAVSARGRPRAG